MTLWSHTDDPFNVISGLEKYPKMMDYGPDYAGLPDCVAFEKHDGSNLAWRWVGDHFESPRFRSGRLVSEEWPTFFRDLPDMRPPPEAERALLGVREGMFFAEFRGDASFAGEHVAGDPKRIHPIDLWACGRGFMPPSEFARTFAVRPVYSGRLTAKFVEDVRSGRLGVNEGVVVKGGYWRMVWCCKIKTREWLSRVEEHERSRR
jgi:hypothetical protein